MVPLLKMAWRMIMWNSCRIHYHRHRARCVVLDLGGWNETLHTSSDPCIYTEVQDYKCGPTWLVCSQQVDIYPSAGTSHQIWNFRKHFCMNIFILGYCGTSSRLFFGSLAVICTWIPAALVGFLALQSRRPVTLSREFQNFPPVPLRNATGLAPSYPHGSGRHSRTSQRRPLLVH